MIIIVCIIYFCMLLHTCVIVDSLHSKFMYKVSKKISGSSRDLNPGPSDFLSDTLTNSLPSELKLIFYNQFSKLNSVLGSSGVCTLLASSFEASTLSEPCKWHTSLFPMGPLDHSRKHIGKGKGSFARKTSSGGISTLRVRNCTEVSTGTSRSIPGMPHQMTISFVTTGGMPLRLLLSPFKQTPLVLDKNLNLHNSFSVCTHYTINHCMHTWSHNIIIHVVGVMSHL